MTPKKTHKDSTPTNTSTSITCTRYSWEMLCHVLGAAVLHNSINYFVDALDGGGREGRGGSAASLSPLAYCRVLRVRSCF